MKTDFIRSTGVRVLIAVIVLSGMSGCGILEGLDLAKPSASIANVSLKDITLDAATLLFDIEVKNPYSVPLPLVNVDYDLTSLAEPFLSGKADLQGSIPARGTKTVSLPARVSYQGLMKVLKGVKPGSVIPYTANMGLSLKPPATGAIRLPLKKEGKVPIPAVPNVEITEIKWQKVGLDEAAGLVKLNLVNRNEFPVDLSKLTYALSLGGVEVAKSSLVKPVAFEAGGGSGDIEIPISFSPRKAGLGLLRVLTGTGSSYNLIGDIDVKTPFGPMSLPISKVGSTVFKR